MPSDWKLMYLLSKKCKRCNRNQWYVPASYDKALMRNPDEKDRAFKKRKQANKDLLKNIHCQYCLNHGEKFSNMIDPKRFA